MYPTYVINRPRYKLQTGTCQYVLKWGTTTVKDARSTKKKNKHIVFVGRLAIQENSVRK